MSHPVLGDRYKRHGIAIIPKPRTLPIRKEYNTGPTARDAVLDLVRLLTDECGAVSIFERLSQ